MKESINFHRLVGEPRAITGFPLQPAAHAELGTTAACHMVTPFVELHHGRAVVALLPPFLLRDLGKLLRGFIFGAFAARVPLAVAGATYFRFAPTAFTISTASVGSTAGVEMYLSGFDPFATTFGRAVNAVFSRILLVFLVPLDLEPGVEQVFDVFQGNMILSAAFGRHMLWIGDRHGKDPTEACMAHAVFTCKFGRFGDWYIRG